MSVSCIKGCKVKISDPRLILVTRNIGFTGSTVSGVLLLFTKGISFELDLCFTFDKETHPHCVNIARKLTWILEQIGSRLQI